MCQRAVPTGPLSLFFFFWTRTVSRTRSLTWAFAGHEGGLRLILCSGHEENQSKAIVMSVVCPDVRREAFSEASRFRAKF